MTGGCLGQWDVLEKDDWGKIQLVKSPASTKAQAKGRRAARHGDM